MATEFSIVTDFPQCILDAVIRLGDTNSKFLGHFPRSAYQREAASERILAAVSNSQELLGYLLFRVARERAVIQHCCVDQSARGFGVGKALVNELKKRVSNTRGIELHCAREFEASCRFWEQVGFIPFSEKKGRGADERPLTRYTLDFRKENFFGSAFDEQAGDRTLAVVDMNIVLDWYDDTRTHFEESSALRADWLVSEVDLRITDHAFTDANQADEWSLRERTRGYLRTIPKVDEDREEAQHIFMQLKREVKLDSRRSTEVDARHLAAAIAGGAEFFITRDQGLLELSEAVRRRYDISVCAPSDFILQLDSARNVSRYEPARLSGCNLVRRRMTDMDIETLSAAFVRSHRGESLRAFEGRLRKLACEPVHSRVEQFLMRSSDPVMLLGIRIQPGGNFEITCLRVKKHELSGLVCRHVLRDVIREASDSASTKVFVHEEVDEFLASILTDLDFQLDSTGWARPISKGVIKQTDLPAEASNATASSDEGRLSADWALRMDRMLWPGQLNAPEIRSIVVPIQPRWAAALFDAELASKSLLDAEPRLMLNLENVYYTAKPTNLGSPCRVLWYVSKDRSHGVVRTIRAASWIAEVQTGPALEIFRKFRHLGVYRWPHVKEASEQNEDGSVAAFRFCNTVTFKHPVDRETFGTLLADKGLPVPPLSAPYTLPDGMYERLCRMGHGQE